MVIRHLTLVPKPEFRPWVCPEGHENNPGGDDLAKCDECGQWFDLGFPKV